VLDDRKLLAAKAVEPEYLAEHSLRAAFALAAHRQIRFIVSAVGPVRGGVAGITWNILSLLKSYMSHTGPAATSKIPLVPGGTGEGAWPTNFSADAIPADAFAGAAQIRHILAL
jgi:hypothetical protein